ncbi:MAG: phosphoribosylaminoimidazole-succinocarboxamide synthase [Candidatus Xenolissoclinum pacificiensis L6]|uniref:Phosphoribosylaminoimidazole-succinocarboxamide synthase n=1 Tax=Candidatus Xenolissoclinum pacificiensis L6 TaxID=1401685 RepID=W2UZS2_9RICK|nr:MAG: phosphoribosylaminoimidazole-succinocarboxamide synthase [Candidatus Xenolissoclinum pacificiensis L6]
MVRQKIHEGKTKILFSYPDNISYICQHFTDNITAFNNQKNSIINGKGTLCNQISAYLMQKISTINIKTHFIKKLNMREQVIKRLKMFPFEIVVRNIAYGSLTKKLPIEDGLLLDKPLIEIFYKDDSKGDPLISEEHIYLAKLASQEQMEEIIDVSLRINDFLLGIFASAEIQLVDLKFEFGTDMNENIVLGDEISPDTLRLWNQNENEPIQILDKDCFRNDLSDVLSTYKTVAYKLNVLKKKIN